MKKPHLKRYGTIAGFTIYIVDGMYIRKYINKEFTNFGQYYNFRFIPNHEFWIDRKCGNSQEIPYFIEHLLVEYRLMEQGVPYNTALRKANAVEQSERQKALARQKFKGIQSIYKKLLTPYSGKIKVWIVNGKTVRDHYFIDFAQGGHDLIYPFVPQNEIWIDDDVSPQERKYIILHEYHERNYMARKIKAWRKNGQRLQRYKIYEAAHAKASAREHFYRYHPQSIEKAIRKEMQQSEERAR